MRNLYTFSKGGLLIIIAILFVASKADAQIPIQYYDFELNSARNTTAELSVEQVINSGTYNITSFGVANPTQVPGAGLSGTTTPGRSGSGLGNGMAYQWDTWNTSFTDPGGAANTYVGFTANTSGFTGISFQFDYNDIGTFNSPYLGVIYSVNGGTSWLNATGGSTTIGYSGAAIWRTVSITLPATCDNLSNLMIRVYGWGSLGSGDQTAFDNFMVSATGTSVGKVFTTLDESAINTSFNSGSTGAIYSRSNFTATGAGTNITINPNGFSIIGAFAATTNATVTFNTAATPSYITGTGGTFNVGSGCSLIITDPSGITTSGATGNVRSTGTRTYNAGANYTYQANTAQVTGNGLPAALTGNLTINNAAGVSLSQATSVGGTGVLALTSGVLTTTATNLLSITNTATSAITRTASGTSDYVDGPLKWSLLSSAQTYVFPVGNLSTYLPYTLATSAAAAPVITLQAFNSDVAAGATFNASLSSISHTEYWKGVLNSGTFTGAVSLTRQAALTTQNVIAQSAAAAGSYVNIGGTPASPSINTSNSTSALGYFVMAVGKKNYNILSNNAFTGANTYCQNAASPTPLSATFNTCNSGAGNATATTVTVTWYYNTTNSTNTGTATQVQQTTGVSTGTSATVTYTYTPSTALAWNTYYYFCVLSSPSNTFCGFTPTLSTGTQLVTIQNSTLTLASGTAVAAANICAATIKVPVQAFTITPSTCNGSVLTDISFSTATGYLATELTKFQLWYGTSNSLGSASQLGVNLTTTLGPGLHTFASFASPTLNSGTTYYFWITMDVAASVTNDHIVTGTAMTTANLTSTNIKVGSAAAGGTQTLKKQTTSTNGGNQAVCQGSTSSFLGGNTPPFGTGLWTVTAGNPADITFSNAASGSSTATASGSASGAYTLTWTTTNGPCSATSSLTLTVNAGPTAIITNPSGVSSICSGTPVTLSGATSTAGSGSIVSYQWYIGGVSIGGATASTYAATTPGSYTLKVTNSNGCSNTSGALVISGNTSPTAIITPSTPGPVCYGTPITLDASSSLAGSGSITGYQWYQDVAGVQTAIGGATASTYNATMGGDYTLKVTSSTGCSNTLAYSIDALVKSPSDSVTSNVPAGITTNPSSYTGCNPSFTVGATGTSITYQWQVSTDGGVTYTNISIIDPAYSGSTTATLTINDPTGLDGYYYRVIITAPAPCSNSVTSTGVLFTQDYTWKLSPADNNWNNGANWNCGVVPNSSVAVVVIPAGASLYPTIGSATTIAVNTLNIASAASVTNTGVLNIAGTINNSGTLTSTAGTIGYTGTTAQTIAANTFSTNTLNGLKVANAAGVTLGGALTVTNVLSFGNVNNSTLTTGGYLTLHSDATNTARVADVTNNGVNSGNTISGLVTVERWTHSGTAQGGRRAYRVLGPSVTTATTIHANWQEGANAWYNNPNPGYGTQITGSTVDQQNGFDQTQTGSASLFLFNPASGWVAIANTNVNTLDAKTGYLLFIRGDRSYDLNQQGPSFYSLNATLRAKGTVTTGTVAWSGLSSTANANALVTNPYPSPIDWTKIYEDGTTANSTNYSSTIQLWDPSVGTRGGYISLIDLGSGSWATSGGTSNMTNEVQSGEAYFLTVNSGLSGTTTYTVKEKHKSTTNNLGVLTPLITSPRIDALVYYTDPILGRLEADGVSTIYDNKYCACVDGNDAQNFTNIDEDIAIMRNGQKLSIETRPLIVASDTMPLYMTHMKTQSYQWQFNVSGGFAAGMTGILVDNYTGTRTPVSLTDTTLISFNVDVSIAASKATNRFYVVFTPQDPLPVTITSIKAYQHNTGVNVDWTVSQQINMGSYEVEKSLDGRSFTHAGTVAATPTTGAAAYSWFDPTPNTGANYYRVKVIDRSSATSYTNIVRVDIASAPPAITVYPNPVKGNTFTLQLTNVDKGNYTMMLINKLGQVIYTREINHAGGSGSETITLDRKVAQGTYELKMGSFSAEIIKE